MQRALSRRADTWMNREAENMTYKAKPMVDILVDSGKPNSSMLVVWASAQVLRKLAKLDCVDCVTSRGARGEARSVTVSIDHRYVKDDALAAICALGKSARIIYREIGAFDVLLSRPDWEGKPQTPA